MRVLGVVQAYNEDDCVQNAIRSLAAGGVDVHVFDHGSTDGTFDKIQEEVNAGRAAHHRLDRERVPATDSEGRQTDVLLNHIGSWVRSVAEEYDWVVWQASDEIIRQPGGELLTEEALRREHRSGVQVIRPLIRNFRPTTADPTDEPNYLRRLRHYEPNNPGHAPRAWQAAITPEHFPIGLHIQDPSTGPKAYPWYSFWPRGTNVSNNRWLLDHYPIRTREQARKKALDRGWIGPHGRRRYQRYLKANNYSFEKQPMKHVESRELAIP